MKNDLLQIIQFYGVNHQQRKFNEEVFELQEAIIDCNTYDEFAQADMNVFNKNREYFVKHIIE